LLPAGLGAQGGRQGAEAEQRGGEGADIHGEAILA